MSDNGYRSTVNPLNPGWRARMVALDISHASRIRLKTGALGQERVVPQSVSGRIRRIKWAMLCLCLSAYYLTPFLRWNRGPGEPTQAVLLDFEHGRLYAFFVEIWPQELYYLTGLLVLAATVLVLMNAVAGRIWCGFLCPQTIWTDLFLLVERKIEGDRRERLLKQKASITLRRVAEIAAKHLAWISISVATGGALVFYFVDAPMLVHQIAHGEASLLVWSWILIFAGTTYCLAGFAREQVCVFMCPWPRLQGAIWDPEALSVNYRDYRGEKRMSAKKAADFRARGEQVGDCVDCGQCAVVCPIGIDIRQGPNIACINCGLCVDACDGVMKKLNRPRGLIDYEAWTNIERGRSNEPRLSRLVRPKTLALAATCIVLTSVMGYAFATRSTGALFVEHDRNPRFVMLAEGDIRNSFDVKIANHSGSLHAYTVAVEGIDDGKFEIVGGRANEKIDIPAGESRILRATVTSGRSNDARLRFVARDESGRSYVILENFVVR